MTKADAKRQARSESSMYRQGSGWITSVYDPDVQCNQLSHERPYQVSRQAIADWRLRRIDELTGTPASSL